MGESYGQHSDILALLELKAQTCQSNLKEKSVQY